MPVRHLEALFEPRSITVIADSFAPGAPGGLALAALTAAKPRVPVTLIGPVPAGAPFPAVPSLDAAEHTPDLALITLPASNVPPVLSTLGKRAARAAIITQHDNHDPDLRRR